MLDIGKQQFLMLLFVIEAQFQKIRALRAKQGQFPPDRLIDG